MNIVLIGYRCAGKSSVGKKLASRLQKRFVDTDDLLEQRQQASICDMVRTRGWGYFREVEKEVIQEISSEDHLVIAAGGGVVLDRENVAALKKNGLMVWLKADRQVLHNRMIQDPRTLVQRPSLTEKGALEELDEVMASRAPFYEAAMEVQLDTSAMDEKTVVESVLSILRDREVI
jgi:shikimate kinase